MPVEIGGIDTGDETGGVAAVHFDLHREIAAVDEVNGTVSSSLIIPLNMLKCREKMIDEINAKFGLNASVRLSGAWRAEVTKYENETGEADIDNAETEDAELETPAEEKEVSEDVV